MLSPSLFNIYSEEILREATENTIAGIKIGDRTLNNFRYASDTTLLCKSKDEQVELLSRIEHLSQRKGLHLNTKTTKIMALDRKRTDFSRFDLDGWQL